MEAGIDSLHLANDAARTKNPLPSFGDMKVKERIIRLHEDLGRMYKSQMKSMNVETRKKLSRRAHHIAGTKDPLLQIHGSFGIKAEPHWTHERLRDLQILP